MDSELEAILAESDGSDDGAAAGLSLEDILKEDEALGGDESPGLAQALSYARLREDDDEAPASDDDLDGGAYSTTETPYSARDWAVLQQILREEEEGDDGAPRRPVAPPADDAAPEPPRASPRASPRSSPRPAAPPAPPAPEPRPAPERAPSAAEPPPRGPTLWRGERLAAAAAREARLVAGGGDVVTSPLQMKRRARARAPALLRREGWEPPASAPATRRSAASGRGVARAETMGAISRQLGKNAQYRAHGPGLPCAFAVRAKFVAIGTSRGLTLVFDHFQEVRRVLGTASDDGVSSVDLSVSGDLVACGHASGKVALWDVIKGANLKTLDDAHGAPIAALRFYRDDDAAVVSVDGAGVVNKLGFTKAMFGAYGADVECLLDGAAGVAPSLATLPSAPWGKETCAFDADARRLVAFSSDKASFVVALEPGVKVLHKWPRSFAKGSGDDAADAAPAVDWAWDESTRNARLARAWGADVMVLQADRTLEDGGFAVASVCDAVGAGELARVKLPAPAVAIRFVGRGGRFAVLDASDALRLIDGATGHQLDAVNFSAYFAFDDPAAAAADAAAKSAAAQNAIRVDSDKVYCLGASELCTVRLQTPQQRVDALVDAGEWLEALALALDDAAASDGDEATKLLRRYVALAIDNAPGRATEGGALDLARSHFQMLGGVCVEFCVETKRLDVLFGEIYESFLGCDRADVFLDLLEPYVLSGKLRRLAPEVMKAFVEHFRDRGALVAVERCLLHLDATALDFNMLASLLKTHRLYSALCRVYSAGLGDYVAPLEMVLDGAHEEASKLYFATPAAGSRATLEASGRQALLYVRYCLGGLAFPSGDALEADVADRVRPQILHFLLQKVTAAGPGGPDGFRASAYAHVRLLMCVDARALLDCFSVALSFAPLRPAFASEVSEANPYDATRASVVEAPRHLGLPTRRRFLEGPLLALGAREHDSSDGAEIFGEPSDQNGAWAPSADDRVAFFDFVAGHAARRVLDVHGDVPRKVVRATLAHLVRARENDDDDDDDDFEFVAGAAPPPKGGFDEVAGEHVDALDVWATLPRFLGVVDAATVDVDAYLSLAKDHGKPRHALALRKFVASTRLRDLADARHLATPRLQRDSAEALARALACYVGDPGDARVFAYASRTLRRFRERSGLARLPPALVQCVLDCLPKLADLDGERTAALCCDHFPDDLAMSLQRLAATPRLQFAFLDALVARADEAPVGAAREAHAFVNVGDAERTLYVHLLCDFAPEKVYDYLNAHDGYDVDEILDLCRARGIPDATALLLEQTGEATAALRLILSTLQKRFEDLRSALRVANRDGRFSLHCTASPTSPAARKSVAGRAEAARPEFSDGRAALEALPEGVAAAKMLDVALRLCRRHGDAEKRQSDADPHGAWFATLDRLVEGKRSLQLSRELPSNASLMHAMVNDLVQQTLSAMAQRVPLAAIVAKIFDDHADSNLGEFRHIIMSMLDTTRYDVRIHEAVRDLEKADAHALREAHVAKQKRGVLVVPDPSIPKEAWGEAGGLLEATPPANPSDPWTAKLKQRGDGARDLARKRRRALRNARADVGTLSSYESYFKTAQSENDLVRERALTLVLDATPRGRAGDDHHRVSTRVPGMLEVRAKFYAELPKDQAVGGQPS